MRILNRYLIHDFLVIFGMTLAVFTFVMSVGSMFQATDYIAKGASSIAILKIFLYTLPFTLTFSIPISIMTGVLLLFSRLSMDGEITAMKACGISIWEIVAPIVMVSILFSFVCLYLNSYMAPSLYHKRRQVIIEIGGKDPMSLLEEGRFTKDFPGFMIYVGRKHKTGFEDVILYAMTDKGTVKNNIRAQSGEMQVNKEEKTIKIVLNKARIYHADEEQPDKLEFLNAEYYEETFALDEILKKEKAQKKRSDMTFHELVKGIRNVKTIYPNLVDDDLIKARTTLVVEANKRLALAITCFAFTILGLPLGIKTKRKESSIGVGISLGLVFFFYFFIILAESMLKTPQYKPELVIWIPVVVSEGLGFVLLRRMA